MVVLVVLADIPAQAQREQPRVPESVRAEFDVPYAGTENPRQRLDLLLPASPRSEGPLPVIAFIHGGGWRGGDKRAGLGQLVPFVASGEYAAVSIDPPFLFIHGDEDRLVPLDQSELLHEALEKAGVSSVLVRVEGGGHGGFRNPEINQRIRRFFDKHLLGKDATVSGEPVAAGAPEAQ